MEKDYAERVRDIKNEILKEIREILPDGETHKFKETFYVHYVNGEVATTEICEAIRNDGGCIGFKVNPDESIVYETYGFVDGEDIFNFEPNTFIDVYENLRKELREEKLAKLRKIIVAAGGELTFDGNFIFTGCDEDNWFVPGCELTSLRISDGKIIVGNNFEGNVCENGEAFLASEEIDRMIGYAEEKTLSRFALTDEQNKLMDILSTTIAKLQESGVATFTDFGSGALWFLNTNGKKVEIVKKGTKGNVLTNMAVSMEFTDFLCDLTIDDIVLA